MLAGLHGPPAAQVAPRREAAQRHMSAWATKVLHNRVSSPWKLNAALVCSRLFDIIDAPHIIQQGSFGTCGPASMLYVLFRRFPLEMARFSTELYEHGRASLGARSIVPDAADVVAFDYEAFKTAELEAATRDERPPPRFPPHADFMLQGTIQDDVNLIYDFNAADPDTTGTSDARVYDILNGTGWYKRVRYDVLNVTLNDMPEAFQDNAGVDIIISTHRAYLDSGRRNSNTPHLVALQEKITRPSPGQIRAALFNSGTTDAPIDWATFNEQQFNQEMTGFVIAES